MKHIFPIIALFATTLIVAAGPVDELIPQLVSDDIGSRYDAQMKLQALASDAAKPGNEPARATLAATLSGKAEDSNIPQPARVWIVRQLEYIGRGEAIPALTALLTGTDAELRECARRALEKNPDPKSTVALRAALQNGGDATWKIGLIRSLGQKRDAESVPLIAASLNDPKIGGDAARSLGRIASPAAITALWNAFKTQPDASDGLARAIHYLIADGKKADAKTVALQLYQQTKQPHVRAAALSQLAEADPAAAEPLITAALQGNDRRLQKTAVDAAPVATLTALFPKLPASAKAFTLYRLDATSENLAITCAAERDDNIRIAALEALGRIGSAASVPVLVRAAVAGNENEKTVAAAALASINGPGAANAIEKLATAGEPAARVVAINALTGRAAAASVPLLMRLAGDSDSAVSRAALAGLAKLGGDETFDGLVQFVLAKKPGAREALQKVAARSQNKAGVSQKLVAQSKNATGPQLVALFNVMALVGGDDALNAVAQSTATGSDEVRDGAIRALCNWREFAAVTPLLAVAGKSNATLSHQVLALQAVSRLIRDSKSTPAAERVNAAQAALKTATRPEEKTQIISALGAINDRKAGEALIALLAIPALKADAAMAAMNMAEAQQINSRPLAKQLAEAVRAANVSPELNKLTEPFLAQPPPAKKKKKK